MTQRDKWKGRPCVLHYFAFRDEVQYRKVEIPIPSRITFFMPMPKSWSGRQKERMDGHPHEHRPDIDNLLRALLDSVFGEDNIVWSVWPEKRWSRMPGIKIEPIQSQSPERAAKMAEDGLP
jgi:Holliday junction resolvase RusA-like endonuclease